MLNGLRDRFHQFPHRTERSRNASWQLPLNCFQRFHAHTVVYLMPLAHSLSTVQRKNLGTSHTKNRPKRYLLRWPLGAIHGFDVPGLPAPPAASAPEREGVDDFVVGIFGREAERQLAVRAREELDEVEIAQRGGELKRGAVRCPELPVAPLAVFPFSVDAVAVDVGAKSTSSCTMRTLPTDTAAKSGVWPVTSVVLAVTRLCPIIRATASSFVVMALKERTMS